MAAGLSSVLILIIGVLTMVVGRAQPSGPNNTQNGEAAEAPLRVGSAYGVGGLVLWLAADSGVTLDKANSNGVAILNDKTGNFILTPDDAKQEPIYVADGLNGKPVLRFNGGQSLYSPDDFGTALNHDMTFIIVAMTNDSPDREQFPLYLGQNSTPHVNRNVSFYKGDELFDGQYVACTGPKVATNAFVVMGSSINPTLTEANFYRNGRQLLVGTVSETNKKEHRTAAFEDLSGGVTMGAATDPVCGWRGDIAEELVYNHQLSPAEMQTVWVYLSNKYGFQAGANPHTVLRQRAQRSSPDGSSSLRLYGGVLYLFHALNLQ